MHHDYIKKWNFLPREIWSVFYRFHKENIIFHLNFISNETERSIKLWTNEREKMREKKKWWSVRQNLEKMIIWWVFIISAASIHSLSRYLFFCFNAIENRFNFISFRPGSFIRSPASAVCCVCLVGYFSFSIWHEFYFRPWRCALNECGIPFLFFFLSVFFCNLQSLPIFKNEYKLVDSYRKAFRIFPLSR